MKKNKEYSKVQADQEREYLDLVGQAEIELEPVKAENSLKAPGSFSLNLPLGSDYMLALAQEEDNSVLRRVETSDRLVALLATPNGQLHSRTWFTYKSRNELDTPNVLERWRACLSQWIDNEPNELKFLRANFSEPTTRFGEFITTNSLPAMQIRTKIMALAPNVDIEVQKLSGEELAQMVGFLKVIGTFPEDGGHVYEAGTRGAEIWVDPLSSSNDFYGQPAVKGRSFMYLQHFSFGGETMSGQQMGVLWHEIAKVASTSKPNVQEHSEGNWFAIRINNSTKGILLPARGSVITVTSQGDGQDVSIIASGINERAATLQHRFWFGHRWMNYTNPDTEIPANIHLDLQQLEELARERHRSDLVYQKLEALVETEFAGNPQQLNPELSTDEPEGEKGRANSAMKSFSSTTPRFDVGRAGPEIICCWWGHHCNHLATHHIYSETEGKAHVEFYCQRHYVPALAQWLDENEDNALTQLVDWGIC